MTISGAQAIVTVLEELGIDRIFGYPGGAIMPTYDALYNTKKLKHILMRHEQCAAHAAEGYARVSGKLGVCIATSGPGATNLVTGIADAMLDSIPILCITGQVSSLLLGSDAFQEADIIGMTVPITKWNTQVTSADQIPEALVTAFHIAMTGRPGPVVVDITKDAQLGIFQYNSLPLPKQYKALKLNSPKSYFNKAANLINNAKKPLFLVGHGLEIAMAERICLAIAEKANIPIATTLHGLSCIPANHPLNVGMLGMHGSYAANLCTQQADCIIAVGMRFDDRVTGDVTRYAPRAKIIHIEIDEVEFNKIIKVEVAILADAKQALETLLPLVDAANHKEWLDVFYSLAKIEHDKVISSELYPKEGKLLMAEVINNLSELTKGEAIIVTDVGQHQMQTARYYKFNQIRSNITSGGLGTMGFALPAAIGAKIAAPNRQVIVIVGDGGFQMTLQELAVLKQENIAVKIIILNNSFLGMVRQWQELFFEKRYSFTKMDNPDFALIANAYSIESAKVENRENLLAHLSAMLESKKSYLLDVTVEQKSNVFPMVPSGGALEDIRLN